MQTMKTPRCAQSLAVRARQGLCLLLSAVCLGAALVSTMPAPVAEAATQAELEQQLAALEEKLAAEKAQLSAMKQNTAAAKKQKENLESQISTVKKQISVLASSIAEVQGGIAATEIAIAEKEAEIAAKEAEIEAKQADIDRQWADFKQRMAAMQELNDSGAMAMLSAVKNLYQLLTFSDVMQDISVKDTEIMEALKTAKAELEQAKVELEQAKAELEAQKADLEAQQATLERQQAQMKDKQNELSNDLSEAKASLSEAQAAQAEVQALVDSDEMDYEAVKDEIQKIIATAANGNASLSFTGFICPLKSYTRLSSQYGYRSDPISGATKFHGGMDFAAPAGTPIYAAAGGYVSVATKSSSYGNYVVIYHGTMGDGVAYSTLYAHMSSLATSAGASVSQGQLIGYVGSTGKSTGNHLHLEVWQGRSQASRVNPASYVPTR